LQQSVGYKLSVSRHFFFKLFIPSHAHTIHSTHNIIILLYPAYIMIVHNIITRYYIIYIHIFFNLMILEFWNAVDFYVVYNVYNNNMYPYNIPTFIADTFYFILIQILCIPTHYPFWHVYRLNQVFSSNVPTVDKPLILLLLLQYYRFSQFSRTPGVPCMRIIRVS